ncbi:hypothetical protein CAPTEDRAFT_169426 [Capitella teleta]|uniref:beta-N-acetylhexosaminidase n=1 Tax=Capitella teleta TaxID=283909 RepID=R7TS87_CAPTE|nr:hypothetical protein CAPTEDRAFT_169426 [Capitella teleta]|eukprot:ELT96467.1 hypothetical protein CAPTEDRAFT_169426 [Capitella teleta]
MEVETIKSSEHRLVHLDLKGAPPKLSYLQEIIPLMHRWGVTGLLVEYEDMFPYSGEIQEIACANAYRLQLSHLKSSWFSSFFFHSVAELNRLLEIARRHDMIVIPLTQTFGHFEFVLKHDKWHKLREVPISPLTLCPLNEGSLSLLYEMMDQILALHPDSKWLHIGADEVYHIGICPACAAHMRENSLSLPEMFLSHIRRLLDYLREKHPNIQPIMWDDMLRAADLAFIQKSNIGNLVEPMVWFYGNTFDIPLEIWDRYAAAFETMWVASAFKGATGPRMFATDIMFHAGNQKMWLSLVDEFVKPKFKSFRGYAVTGWSRYDHYAVLCELLPVGLPSLAICTLILKHGGFSEEVHKQASEDLNFSTLVPLVPNNSINQTFSCDFPGCRIYLGIQYFIKLRMEYKSLMTNDRLKGWMTPYHVRHNYTNPVHLEHFLIPATEILNGLKSFRKDMEGVFSEALYADAVDEWLAVNVDARIERLASVVAAALAQVKVGGRVKGYQVNDVDMTSS